MAEKRYQIKTACPQCGCSAVSHLSAEEIQKKYGKTANVTMECHACMAKYHEDLKTACPEWDDECKAE